MNKKDIEITNTRFKHFVLDHASSMFLRENQQKYISKIQKEDNIPFDNDWNYLMLLVEIIENKSQPKRIIISDNYCCFEYEDFNIQDKGIDKIEAVYNCCKLALIELV